MVLDDEPFTLKIHGHMLAEMGFVSASLFETGAHALEAIDRGPAPDLILLDLSMPAMDGIEFIRHLVPRGFSGSLLLVSAEDERLLQTAASLVRAHGMNALGHLKKPVKPLNLKALLDEWEAQPARGGRSLERSYDADELRQALSRGEVGNYYQPKISLRTGHVVAVEALARWHHPEDGVILPGQFINTAVRHGLIDSLTRRCFTNALDDIRALEQSGFPLRVSINLAAPILASVDFADFASAEAQRASVRPHEIVLEVTESQLINDMRTPLEVLTRLRLMRFSLSIDDFGTGYSSLAQLRNIPFDELKIDQSFVHRSSKDPTARAMYDASLGLARQLNMKTVAEGVEDRADWDLVKNTGCDEAQGFFIARPMPAGELLQFRRTWSGRVRSELDPA